MKIIPAGENIKIIICTTEKENEKINKTTKEVVEEYILAHQHIPVSVCHYPYNKGNMAHQLNYTIKNMLEHGLLHEHDYISIYNADSRPHTETYHWVLSQLNTYNNKYVFQQSAVFLRNYDKLNDYFAKVVALYQSCWTLTHEIPRLRRQANSKNILSKWSNVHCVGHGLFIRVDILNKMGLFPVDTLTEDTYLGYKLRCSGITIYPVPFIEVGDSPLSFRSAMRQKFVWFWGPMLYPYYLFKYFQEEKNIYLRLKSVIFACQGTLNAIRWLIAGPLILLAIILPWTLSVSIWCYLLSFISIFLYSSLPVLGIPHTLDILEKSSGQNLYFVKDPINKTIVNLVHAVFHSLLHSIPPIFSLISAFRMLFTNYTPRKRKTDE